MMRKEELIQKLGNLINQTQDSFTKKLILMLQSELEKKDKISFYEELHFNRINCMIEKEQKRNRLKNIKIDLKGNILYVFKVSVRGGKKRTIEIKGNKTFLEFSDMIQTEFDHEPMHLYEFKIGNYNFGPECDEWQEIFDHLDNIKIEAVIKLTELKKGDKFKFIYDFGENIKHIIKLIEIKNESNSQI